MTRRTYMHQRTQKEKVLYGSSCTPLLLIILHYAYYLLATRRVSFVKKDDRRTKLAMAFESECGEVPRWWIVLALAEIVVGVGFLYLVAFLPNIPKPEFSETTADDGNARAFATFVMNGLRYYVYIISKIAPVFFTLGGITQCLHFIVMIILMGFKLVEKREVTQEENESTYSEDGQMVILFSSELSTAENVFFITVGKFLGVAEEIIDVLPAPQGLAKLLWFPQPFYEFAKREKLIRHMSVKGAKIQLSASYKDVYFTMCKNMLHELLFLGLYKTLRLHKLKNWLRNTLIEYGWLASDEKENFADADETVRFSMEAWLDSKLGFVGLPPPGFSNYFVVFDYENDVVTCPPLSEIIAWTLLSLSGLVNFLLGILYFDNYNGPLYHVAKQFSNFSLIAMFFVFVAVRSAIQKYLAFVRMEGRMNIGGMTILYDDQFSSGWFFFVWFRSFFGFCPTSLWPHTVEKYCDEHLDME